MNGEPQLDQPEEFNYGNPSGDATIGSDRDGATEYIGLVDEHRVFTWGGPFNPADLLFFSQRAAGDVNEDGSVDQSDYDIWRMNTGADLAGTSLLDGRSMGDLNGDRAINLDDFALIKQNKSPGATLVVPEPGSMLLATLGSLSMACLMRRRF